MPPLPSCAAYIWQWYWRLRGRKGGNGFGVVPIEWPDIDAFFRHIRVTPTSFEIEIIEMIDDAFLTSHVMQKETETP